MQRVAEGLLNLPRLFEVYADDDALAFSLETLPFLDADMLRALSEEAAAEDPAVTPLSPVLATAVVGGIDEMMLEAVEAGHEQHLDELAGAAIELIRAVLAR